MRSKAPTTMQLFFAIAFVCLGTADVGLAVVRQPIDPIRIALGVLLIAAGGLSIRKHLEAR